MPLVKVYFPLNDSDWHGCQSESLWAEQISDSRCKLKNSPFYAKGVSFEDVVFVRHEDGRLVYEKPSLAAGHSTYRVILSSGSQESIFLEYWKPLEQLGCTFEKADEVSRLFSVDVPPRADIYAVYSLLEKGEKDGVWGFEEGHCGHPLRE